jgi:anti-sigma B factor antagonist
VEPAVNVTRRTLDGVTVLALSGDLDGRSAAVADDISQVLQSAKEVLLDMSGVQYLSSAGLRVMLIVYRQAQCLGTKVVVVGLSSQLRTVMQATGFLGFFLVADSPEAAIGYLRAAVSDEPEQGREPSGRPAGRDSQ